MRLIVAVLASPRLATAGIACLAALVLAPQAHADANTYLQYIQEHHINVGISNPSKQLWMGNTACQELHEGRTPDQIAATPTIFDIHGIIDAAQHELCPDTLGR